MSSSRSCNDFNHPFYSGINIFVIDFCNKNNLLQKIIHHFDHLRDKMGNNFFAYMQQLELMAFFSGYSLLYAIILVFAGNKESGNNFKSRIVSILPLSYALVSTLYMALQLKNLSPNYWSATFF
jgi:hypothetical protein